ncbi:hypothetical protein ISS30_10755 [bacterium]|nr:hypothetical protein [bacterium]
MTPKIIVSKDSTNKVTRCGGFARRVTIDIDASPLRQATHTKEGARPDGKGHGKDSFQISCAFGNGQIISSPTPKAYPESTVIQ